MKYMGSKRAMLRNGLGEALDRAITDKGRFVDLFAGSAAVSWHVAQRYSIPVFASDLQQFSVALALGVLARDRLSESADWEPRWIAAAQRVACADPLYEEAERLQARLGQDSIAELAEEARGLCNRSNSPFCRAYGGWYYSPLQAIILDSLRRTAASTEGEDVAIASIIQAASICAASPGHTAQPFKSTTRAAPFLVEAWMRDVVAVSQRAAKQIGSRHALVRGTAVADDALNVAATLVEGDLAFLDPPYSSVHYSRFYHVLEALARNQVGEVSGQGRYPEPSERPQSDFSVPTRADDAFLKLMGVIANSGASAMVTFPAGGASNRLSGSRVREISGDLFEIEEEKVSSRFSTMGGDRLHRSARQDAEELILTLRPR